MINKLIKGDNIEIMKSIDENYVDLIITYINNIDSMNIHISTLWWFKRLWEKNKLEFWDI